MPFTYYPGRESAWLLAQMMAGDTPVPALRAGRAAPLMGRPVLQPLIAACGGTLRQRDVLALAHAQNAGLWEGASPAGLKALEPVFGADWHDYTLSLTEWGSREDWRFDQISRPGCNLVLQVGFPSAHAQVFGKLFASDMRRKLEYRYHPIRRDGPPTLAWVRLDVDLETGTALIEEVQSDWLRLAARQAQRAVRRGAQDRELRTLVAYEQALVAEYAKVWPRAALLAALFLLREEFAVRDIWMHQPAAGARLKGIDGTHPPRSLYTSLPKAFCFAPTRDAPPFLCRTRKRHLAQLRRDPGPLFWRLAF
ncbi:MAG: hypothetical protein AAGM84_13285 [Pseudomonadota bacterium]